MKLTPSTVDVPISTLDQQAPVTDKPIGRLSSLINGQVRQYQNPRPNVADGSITHIKVEKRDAFVTLSTTTKDTTGQGVAPASGTPQILYGGGDALRQIVNNRLYTRSNASWVKATNATDGDSAVFPHVLRSSPIYAADSNAQAPDFAVIGDVQCAVWREASESLANNCPPDLAGTTPPPAVPTAIDGVRVQLSDSNGVVRPAFTLDPVGGGGTTYLKARVVAVDGVFLVFQDYYTVPTAHTVQIYVTAIDTFGRNLGVLSLSVTTGNESWDVTTMNAQGAVVAMPNNGTGVRFTALHWSGTTFGVTTNTDATIQCGSLQCAWLTDANQAANIGYLASVGLSGSTSNIYEYIITSLAQTHAYPAASFPGIAQVDHYISGITGYVVPGTQDLVVAYSIMDMDPVLEATTYGGTAPDCQNGAASDDFTDQMNNAVYTRKVSFIGVVTPIAQRNGMSLATRAFALGTDYVAVGYYPGVLFGPLPTSSAATPHFPQRPVNPSNFQPCWYVIPLALPQPIAGRFEYGLATADYQLISFVGGSISQLLPTPLNRCLTSVQVLPNGAIAMPLGYRAEQNIPSNALFTGTPQQGAPIGTFTTVSYQTNNTVGIKLFTMGPDFGQPFLVGQATYVPGLMGAIVEPFDVAITEQGLAGPECPRIQKSSQADPGNDIVAGAYAYRGVFEQTTPTGRLYRSLPSASFSYTALKADALALDIIAHPLFPTNKKNVKFSWYRTGQLTNLTVAGSATTTSPPSAQQEAAAPLPNAASTGSYKITNDLTPFYSAPGSQYGVFTDYMNASSQATGELLYTDQGQLPRFPAPAFRGGCVWLNRAWVIGYDNALWFTGAITDGQGEWFNPGQRVVVPTNEEITSIASLDSFLLVFCQRSIWYLPETSSLPDATGVGTVPTAIRLPFEMGGTGSTSVIRQGCLYTSSQGGVWMITRALDNVWIGQAAKDDLDGILTGMVIAGNNVLVTNGSYVMAYDTNLGGWGRWNLPTDTTVIGAFAGQGVYCNNGQVWAQTPGQWQDQDTVGGITYYAPTTATIAPVHIGGVRSWKRTWEIQAQGEVFDFCALTFTLSYGDYNLSGFGYAPVNVTPGELEEALRPPTQLAASMGLTVTDAAVVATSNGRGFSLEVISFYIGLEKGLVKLALGKRAGS